VVEGIVEVSRPNEPVQTLTAGQQLTAQAGGGVTPPQQIRTPEPAAWRNGRLVYIDAPLSEIVADANRYSRTHIDLAGEGVENLRLSVTYRADQVDQMIESLPRSLPVELTRAESGHATLRARAESH
jgi:transmembrane sensor